MTEADARVLLRDCSGFGGLEAWIASRRWKTAPSGWAVTGCSQALHSYGRKLHSR
jgi:hypothetical protein